MSAAGPLKHRLYIHEIGRMEPAGTLVEVHSRGGTLLGLKNVIDEFSELESLGIKTIYENKKGASYLGVIFTGHNPEATSEKLDDYIEKRHEFQIRGYFSDAVGAATIINQQNERPA